ncbi:hypothetical protein PBY51_008108 [Eleginops maclovinus]|uniref:Uncharacterized protein n=1 Tax=Eleginops maclovinus TaxID=56733 RepID=A0AAN7XAD8_ELEMC|nr:hypothetical protein PBY51_008108 [Eleginops maclovinus]
MRRPGERSCSAMTKPTLWCGEMLFRSNNGEADTARDSSRRRLSFVGVEKKPRLLKNVFNKIVCIKH